MQIAETILEQLKWGSMARFWSWGGNQWIAMPETKDYSGALRFLVSGRKFAGRVEVQLAWSDTYNILLNDKKVASDIYCDQLAEVVDRLVEM